MAVAVAVGGTGVEVKVAVDVRVGVAVGGTGVQVKVGGTGVNVEVAVEVQVEVIGNDVLVSVAVGGTVEAPKPRPGKALVQSDPVSGAVIRTFDTIQEACLALRGSHKSFHHAATTHKIYKDAVWAFATT